MLDAQAQWKQIGAKGANWPTRNKNSRWQPSALEGQFGGVCDNPPSRNNQSAARPQADKNIVGRVAKPKNNKRPIWGVFIGGIGG